MTKNKIYTLEVQAKPSYLAQQSEPKKHLFIWSYEIKITNQSDAYLQLLTRHWEITDQSGKIEVIDGVGVVGLQPLIRPNNSFNYTSFCQLTTPRGTMEGYYELQDLEGSLFQIPIPKFILSAPGTITKSFQSKLH